MDYIAVSRVSGFLGTQNSSVGLWWLENLWLKVSAPDRGKVVKAPMVFIMFFYE